MLKKDRKGINNKYLKKQIILAVIISIYVLSLSFISAKYVVKNVQTYISSSKEFYFYSDKLTSQEEPYTVTWALDEECVIPINLYTKLNSLKKTEYKIAYNIECTNITEGIYCRLSKNEGVIEPEKDNIDAFTLAIDSNTQVKVGDTFEVKVVVKTADITANGEMIETYSKVLDRVFKIQVIDKDEITCRIEDKVGRPYLNLIVTTNNEKITLEFEDKELIFDNTNNIFKEEICYDSNNNGYIDKIEITNNATIKLFKKNSSDFYTRADLEIKGNNLFKIIKKDVNK